jgi:hypothetical protein
VTKLTIAFDPEYQAVTGEIPSTANARRCKGVLWDVLQVSRMAMQISIDGVGVGDHMLGFVLELLLDISERHHKRKDPSVNEEKALLPLNR